MYCVDLVSIVWCCVNLTGRTYLFQAESAKNNKEKNDASSKAKGAFLQSLEVCQRLRTRIDKKEYVQMKSRLLLNLGSIFLCLP